MFSEKIEKLDSSFPTGIPVSYRAQRQPQGGVHALCHCRPAMSLDFSSRTSQGTASRRPAKKAHDAYCCVVCFRSSSKVYSICSLPTRFLTQKPLFTMMRPSTTLTAEQSCTSAKMASKLTEVKRLSTKASPAFITHI